MAPRVRWTSRSPESCRHRSTGALCFPVSRILYNRLSFRRPSPMNTATTGKWYRDLAFAYQSASGIVSRIHKTMHAALFCFVQMNLSTSTLVLLNRSGSLSQPRRAEYRSTGLRSQSWLPGNHRVSYLKMLVSFRASFFRRWSLSSGSRCVRNIYQIFYFFRKIVRLN